MVAAAGRRSAGLSLHFCGFAARRGRKGERRGASMPAQIPPLRVARAGRAGQFLKKVNWNGSPMKISRPPGIVAANA